jgi:hypothetical protein
MYVIEENDSQQKACAIMGRNFIGIGMVMRHFGVRLSDSELAAMATIPFSHKVLEACKDTHLLFPGYPFTILDVRDRGNAELFYADVDEAWYKDEKFANQERVDPRWYLMRRGPVSDSMDKNWQEQTALLTEGEVVPRACEVVYQTILTYLATGERLFEDVYVRTNDLGSGGYRVRTGSFGSDGLMVSDDYDGRRRPFILGLAAARNP